MYEHVKSKRVHKSNDCFQKYGHVSWEIANVGICISVEDPYVLDTTNNEVFSGVYLIMHK